MHLLIAVLLPEFLLWLATHWLCRPNCARFAYVNLCADEQAIFPSLVLFFQLSERSCTRGDYILLIPEALSSQIEPWHWIIDRLSIKLHWMSDSVFWKGQQLFPICFEKASGFYQRQTGTIRERDRRIWDKLRIWLLTEYERIICLDNDMLILENLDHGFAFPSISGVPMSDIDEKIAFYKVKAPASTRTVVPNASVPLEVFLNMTKNTRTDYKVNVTGLNSGFLVIRPDLKILTNMLSILQKMKQRTCCPSQEFLYHYFEFCGSYNRLPQIYNLRRIEHIAEQDLCAYLQQVKIFHFVERRKPWKILATKSICQWKKILANEPKRPLTSNHDFVIQWLQVAVSFFEAFESLLPSAFIKQFFSRSCCDQ